jgi:GNAT superfamily N-acetyltransferase
MNAAMHWSLKDKDNIIVCRPALPLDTPGMIELTRHIWEGEDYVPEVWADWMVDPEGILAVAESGGVVAGFGKLTRLSQSDWWMEGLRVHPDFEGRGVATRLNDYLLDYWQRTGSGVIRLATVSSREPVVHLSRQKGFQIIGEYSIFKAPITNQVSNNATKRLFQPIKADQVLGAVEWLSKPKVDRLPFGLMDLGWQFAEPKTQYFARYMENKQVWWWKDQQGILIMIDKKDGSDIWARIRMLACEHGEMVELLADVRMLAGNYGYAGVTWMAPLIPRIAGNLSQAGFKRDWDASLLIFEKHHPHS